MIIRIKDTSGVKKIFCDSFRVTVEKLGFFERWKTGYNYSVEAFGSGNFVNTGKIYHFNKLESAQELRDYIVDNINSDYPEIDIVDKLKELRVKD